MLKQSQKHLVAYPWQFSDFSLDVQDVATELQVTDGIDEPNLASNSTFSPLKLPDLDTFDYGPLEDISIESTSTISETNVVRDDDINLYDIWTTEPFDLYDTSNYHKTWEQFGNKEFQEPQLYLSEASQAVWNSVWKRFSASDDSTRIPVRHSQVIRCLIDLGMGLNSTLFTFDSDGHARLRGDTTFSGLSSELSMSITQSIGDCGAKFRMIERFSSHDSKLSFGSRSMVSVVSAICRISSMIREHITQNASQVRTILQVQILYTKPRVLLAKLGVLLIGIRHFTEEESLIDHLASVVRDHELCNDWFYPIALQILCLASQPLLEDISSAIGLCSENTVGYDCSSQLDKLLRDQITPSKPSSLVKKLPELFDIDQEHIILQLYQSLELLKTHKPNHNLVIRTTGSLRKPLRLHLAQSWEDVNKLQAEALEYEASLRRGSDATLTQQVSVGSRISEPDCSVVPTVSHNIGREILDFSFSDAIDYCNALPVQDDSPDGLSKSVLEALETELTSGNEHQQQVPFTLLAGASFTPLLSAQSRLVTRACLNMIFKDGNLIHHLDVMYSFHLLGSGIFTTKLKDALFSPELASAERQKGHQRIGQLGLRLGSRSVWPPASAELRLVLMGVLSECYRYSFPAESFKATEDIPGNLAFGIRNLSEPEIQACMNPMSPAALDFLRLQYRPAHALEAIFDDTVLEKYDAIFRFLLKLSRVSFEIDQVWTKQRMTGPRTDPMLLRPNFEARHFVQALVTYAHLTIATTWNTFREITDSIERNLEPNTDTHSTIAHDGLFQLKSLHNSMLDKIRSDLMLRRRHEKVTQILDEVLTSVLQMTARKSPQTQLAAEFRVQVRRFVITCRELSGSSEYVQKKGEPLGYNVNKAQLNDASSETGLKSLLLSLDINGWYSR